MSKERHSEEQDSFTLFQRLLSSRLITGAGMHLSKHVPPSIGHAVGGLIAGAINWLKPDVYWIVLANLRQVVGEQADERRLHQLVRQVFHNTARNNYDLWHLVSRGQEAIKRAVHLPSGVWSHLNQARQRGRGTVIVGTHTGNFDLGVLALAAHGLNIQVLGLADPPGGGFDLMDRMRARMGVHLTSINVGALREAINRLRAGGVVLTGVDRPVNDKGPWVEFFGHPAPLPTGPVRLALKTNAIILVGGAYRDAQVGTVVRFSPPLEMMRVGTSQENLRFNLRRVTARLEEMIRPFPAQWGMFVPVWPDKRP